MTTVTLSKWGNSMTVRIPNQFLKRLNLEEGAELQILVTPDNDILLRNVPAASDFMKEIMRNTRSILA